MIAPTMSGASCASDKVMRTERSLTSACIANASALSTTVASTFGGPLVKVAAFGYGVRRALNGRKEDVPARAPRRTVIVGRTVPAARRGKRNNRER